MKSPERRLAELAVSKLAPCRTRRRKGRLVRFRKPAGNKRLAKLRADRAEAMRKAAGPPKIFGTRQPCGGYAGVMLCAPIKIHCRYQLAMLTRQADERDMRAMAAP